MCCILSILLSVSMLFSPLLPPTVSETVQAVGNETGTEAGTDSSDGQSPAPAAEGISVSAPSAVLMEASTGQVIFEKEPDMSRHPASITKIMTMILIFDALESGKISLDDTVTVSEYAASMGGSQVFLEPGETQSVDTMLKCISVASANDACASYTKGRHFIDADS